MKKQNRYKLHRRFPFAELRASDNEGIFRIYTFGYQHPEKDNSVEGDWYNNFLYLHINGLRIEIEEPFIQGMVLKRNIDILNDFVENKIRKCEIYFTEPVLSFSLKRRNNGTVVVTGNVTRFNVSRFETNFEYETTLDNIRLFIYGGNKMLDRFPPRNDW